MSGWKGRGVWGRKIAIKMGLLFRIEQFPSASVITFVTSHLNKGNVMKNCLLVFILCFSSAVFGGDKFSRLDSLLTDASRQDIFSGVVLAADNNGVPFLKAYGFADYDKLLPNRTDTKFNIGSIGKLFTQIMTAQLIREGKISLNDNLKKIFPVYNNENDSLITVKELLTFTAGTGDYFRIREFQQNPENYREVLKLVSLISREPLLFKPGTSESYSNSGYVILGGIIERVTGKSYEKNLKERILEPLNMNNSGFVYKDTKVENAARGYIITPDDRKESTYERTPSVPTPAGGMYSTAEDLLKLDRSLQYDNKILDDDSKVLLSNRFDESRKQTWSDLKAEPDFGLGVAGGSPGWNAVYDQNLAGKYTVIILSNFDLGAENISKRILQVLKGTEPSPLQINAGRFIYNIIKEKSADEFVKNYKEYLSPYEIRNDRMLNNTGYQLLQAGYTDAAIAVFLVNTKYFPLTANTYDSLGEAYLAKGDKQNALVNYQKSLDLDPANKNAAEIIQRLKTGN